MFTAALDTSVLWPSLQRDFLLSLAIEGWRSGTHGPVFTAGDVLEILEARYGMTDAVDVIRRLV